MKFIYWKNKETIMITQINRIYTEDNIQEHKSNNYVDKLLIIK